MFRDIIEGFATGLGIGILVNATMVGALYLLYVAATHG